MTTEPLLKIDRIVHQIISQNSRIISSATPAYSTDHELMHTMFKWLESHYKASTISVTNYTNNLGKYEYKCTCVDEKGEYEFLAETMLLAMCIAIQETHERLNKPARIFEYGDQGGIHKLTEHDIIRIYYKHWCARMVKVGRDYLISKENCISDFCTIHWAYEIGRTRHGENSKGNCAKC